MKQERNVFCSEVWYNVYKLFSFKAFFGVVAAAFLLSPVGVTDADAASVVLGGKKVSCGKGAFSWASNVPGVGLSVPGGIIMDRGLKRMHPDLQRFVFLHECAHQRGVINETSADCWAIRRGVYRGLFSKNSILRLCKVFMHTAGGPVHLPGPQRCQAMRQCFGSKKTRRVRLRRKR